MLIAKMYSNKLISLQVFTLFIGDVNSSSLWIGAIIYPLTNPEAL